MSKCGPAPADSPAADAEVIRIRGARVHNLQNLDLDIPRDRLVVITGPSGSGKSSLAFDTLYAEGQRQYIESLSVYARQFLHQIERPDVDLIEGLQPTISIDQRAGSQNPRSTVATVTEIYDYLRLLFARLGEPACYQCGEPIRQQTPEQILDDLLALARPAREVMILAPLVRGRKGRAQGSVRARSARPASSAGPGRRRGDRRRRAAGSWRRRRSHQIEAVVDRVVIREGVDAAAGRIDQPGRASTATGWCWPATRTKTRRAAAALARPALQHALRLPELQDQLRGAGAADVQLQQPLRRLPDVRGLGLARGVRSGAGAARRDACRWPPGRSRRGKGQRPPAMRKHQAQLRAFLPSGRRPLEHAAGEASSRKLREQLLHGDGKDFPRRADAAGKGICHHDQRLDAASGSRPFAARWSARTAAARGCGPRPARCRFARPGDPRSHGPDASPRPRSSSPRSSLPPTIAADRRSRSCSEIAARLEFLDHVGLDYLTLDRPADTLSGGELQRVRLATGHRLGAGRRVLRARRAVDRPAPARQPAADRRPARSAAAAATPWWSSSTTRPSCARPIG